MRVGVVSVCAGNTGSVRNALRRLGMDWVNIAHPSDARGLDALILPGVGHFGAVMELLRKSEMDEMVVEWVRNDKPFLGICIGMQVLFEGSEEAPEVQGLGLLPGQVVRFRADRLPQMGFNRVRFCRWTAKSGWFYFMNSYHCVPVRDEDWLAEAYYGVRFCAAVRRGCVFGVQFHPEKSGPEGLNFLKEWRDACQKDNPLS